MRSLLRLGAKLDWSMFKGSRRICLYMCTGRVQCHAASLLSIAWQAGISGRSLGVYMVCSRTTTGGQYCMIHLLVQQRNQTCSCAEEESETKART